MMREAARAVLALGVAALLAACAGPVASTPGSRASGSSSPQTGTPQPEARRAPSSSTRAVDPQPVDPQTVARLQRVMLPLVRVMDHPVPPDQVKVGIVDDPHINAGSGGHGEFYVTQGLLEKADDQELAGVLAHELAHDDLNHVAKAEALNTGLNMGMVILNQIIPGSGALTPIAGTLIERKYGRDEEYAADRHGAELLQRAGMSPQIMVDTLTWLEETEGTSGGGFFATHPATGDRIAALKREVRAMSR